MCLIVGEPVSLEYQPREDPPLRFGIDFTNSFIQVLINKIITNRISCFIKGFLWLYFFTRSIHNGVVFSKHSKCWSECSNHHIYFCHFGITFVHFSRSFTGNLSSLQSHIFPKSRGTLLLLPLFAAKKNRTFNSIFPRGHQTNRTFSTHRMACFN
ncbi:hypothetical protein C492_00135 [Natronococcus jeotgali DSM 18795]|uniref:Uncharacterized protein n=1 Tax=Natronococcus jeotgali DSM 18795 TaxID=1227498 RepID=L9XZZ7_9EURY|nr:hypothetical protein C492_00135 [Natronococcus jeotgali DSM 18795]